MPNADYIKNFQLCRKAAVMCRTDIYLYSTLTLTIAAVSFAMRPFLMVGF